MSFKNFSQIIFLSFFLTACSETPDKPDDISAQPDFIPTETNNTKPETQIIKRPIVKNRVQLPALLTNLPDEVKKLLTSKGVNPRGMSAFVQSVTSNQPLLAFNADVARNPASVMKLITTYSALGILGVNYQWPVELYSTGSISGGTLHGDLILKGYGYPDFKPKDLKLLLNGLRRRGVRNITGNLIFDNTLFKIKNKNPAAFDNRPYKRYNAIPDALLYNERISEFVVRPVGNTAKITSLHPAKNVTIVNNLKLKNVKCSGSNASPPMRVKKPSATQIKVQFDGTLSSRCGNRHYSTVISDPVNMLYGSLRKMWIEEMGGSITGQKLIIREVPNHAHLLYRINSKPVKDVLPLINKKSNNVMARQLFLSLGANKSGNAPSTAQKSYNEIQKWFLSRGLNFPELRMENGSGLSRSGRISARHVGELLLNAYKSPELRQHLIKSLPIMGVDGTLRRRMRGTVVANRSYMKTGTLRDSRGLAGYVKAQNGKMYVVAILHNDPTAKWKVVAAHNKLVEWTATQNFR